MSLEKRTNPKPKILVVGSANTDMVVKTPRLPMAGETILGGDFLIAQGGKGANQAVAVARLGGQVTFIAKLGADSFGDESILNLQRNGVNTRYIIRDRELLSGVALILVDEKGENMIVVAPGANGNLSPKDVRDSADAFDCAEVLLIQLEIPLETVGYAVSLAHRRGIPVILNPAPARMLDPKLLRKVAFLTPNETELGLLTGVTVRDKETGKAAARKLLDQGVGKVIVTMGSQGSLLVDQETTEMVPSKPVKAVDTTAAGDAFNGALAFGIAIGMEIREAIRFANHAGALAVTKMGAQPSMPTGQEVQEFLGLS